MAIEATHLTVRRLEREVLAGVSLRIADGEIVSVIGPNGAGKSTLMSALLGLLPAAGGTVLLDGVPVERVPRRQIARRIAFVPQMHDGYLGFTVREVVEGGRYPHLKPLDPLGEADRAAVSAAAAAAGVEPLMERTIDTLSGGERQKAWLAAALAQAAPAMFLDEPTNALDPAHQADLIRIMRRYAAQGHTLMIIAHDLNLPLALGGRVVALKGGRVAFDEPVQALLDTRRLAALYDTEFVLHRDLEGAGVSIHVRA